MRSASKHIQECKQFYWSHSNKQQPHATVEPAMSLPKTLEAVSCIRHGLLHVMIYMMQFDSLSFVMIEPNSTVYLPSTLCTVMWCSVNVLHVTRRRWLSLQ